MKVQLKGGCNLKIGILVAATTEVVFIVFKPGKKKFHQSFN